MALIEMDHVGISFRVRQQRVLTLKEFLVGQMFRSSKNPVRVVEALKDIHLTIRRGDRVGLIGHNGAGKSTMLKMLAGVYLPTEGRLTVQGKVSSLFDITLGFEPEATGWENINYRGYLQGETPTTMKKKRDQIAEFSELGDFLNMPIRFYSAGMTVRLAFSIATAIDPEILLVDEVLSMGDHSFQKKAHERIVEMFKRAHLMVMASHDMEAIKSICDYAIWMDHGRIAKLGPCAEVTQAYIESTQPKVERAHPIAA